MKIALAAILLCLRLIGTARGQDSDVGNPVLVCTTITPVMQVILRPYGRFDKEPKSAVKGATYLMASGLMATGVRFDSGRAVVGSIRAG